jgi:hypothetical protein
MKVAAALLGGAILVLTAAPSFAESIACRIPYDRDCYSDSDARRACDVDRSCQRIQTDALRANKDASIRGTCQLDPKKANTDGLTICTVEIKSGNPGDVPKGKPGYKKTDKKSVLGGPVGGPLGGAFGGQTGQEEPGF